MLGITLFGMADSPLLHHWTLYDITTLDDPNFATFDTLTTV